MRLTRDELAHLTAKRAPEPMRVAPVVARATLRVRKMNGTETRYSERLEMQRRTGEVREWAFECMKLRLADDTFYTPDFRVVLADGTLEMHETKGLYIREDAMVKLKVAAEQHPFRFFLCVLEKDGRWNVRQV